MNQITVTHSHSLPRLPSLAEAVLLRLRGGATTEALPEEVRQAARDALPAFERRLAPATAETWHRFLLPLAAMVRNPPGTADIQRFALACASALQDIPVTSLTVANQRAAAREFSFWPAVADLAKMLDDGATRELRADVRGLRRMAEAPLLLTPFQDRETPEEKAVNAEQNRLTVAKLKAAEGRGGADDTPSRSRPNLYGPEQRIAEYRRLGQHEVADAIARHHGLPTRTTA